MSPSSPTRRILLGAVGLGLWMSAVDGSLTERFIKGLIFLVALAGLLLWLRSAWKRKGHLDPRYRGEDPDPA